MIKNFNIIKSWDDFGNLLEKSSKSGKVCRINSINSNILSESYYNSNFREIIASSTANFLDGKFIKPLIQLILWDKGIHTITGPDLFNKLIKDNTYNHLLLGGFDNIRTSIAKENKCYEIGLDFKKVNEFDYKKIAEKINNYDIDIVWISLGAPKQEIFASYLAKHLKKGILIPVGAAFDFYHEGKRAPYILQIFGLEWLFRLITDRTDKTRKRLVREFVTIPKIFFYELKLKFWK